MWYAKKSIIMMLALFVFATPLLAQTFSIRGYAYVPLWSACRDNDIEFVWDSFGRVATLRKNGIEAKLRVNSDKILVSSSLFKDIGPPVRFHEGMVVIPNSFSRKELPRLFSIPAVKSKRALSPARSAVTHRIKKIVIDPGHGGKDPGAIGRYGLKEKDVALDISKRLKGCLEGEGIKVVLTRSTDIFIPLWKRSEIANEQNADFFISIHANAFRKGWMSGFEVYHLSDATDDIARAIEAAENNAIKFEKNSISRYSSDIEAIVYDLKFYEDKKESNGLAESICKSAKKKLYIRDRGVKAARFHVLKNTQMPAVLVEVGFVSNKGEEQLLKDASYRDKVAGAVADGILAYKDEYERTNGFTR